MTTSRMRSLVTLAATAAVAMLANTPAGADDTELFVGAAVAAAPSRPNILFIMDTSGSMDTNVVTQVSFNPADTYSGSCRTDRVYWSSNNSAPNCSTDRYVAATAFTCNAAQPNLDSSGIAYVTKAARWRSSRNRWEALSAGDSTSWIECQADAGIHGQTAASTKKFAADGSTNGPWSSNTANKIDWSRGDAITFYSGNYLNWKASPTITRSRLEIMQEVLTTLLTNLDDNVNVGLMRYSNDGGSGDTLAQGGMVVKEMGKIEDNRTAMQTELNSWDPDGYTPVSETLYEATQYYRGDKVYFGGGANATTYPSVFSKSDKFTSTPNGDTPSVTAARNASDKTLYDSPADQDCQKNYIVFLTDGLPTADNEANTRIQSLPDFTRINGRATCDGTESNGKCADDLSKWLHEADLRPDRPGVQNVTLKWPNDVLGGQKKIAGILLELVGDPADICHVVLGIGINVNMQRADEVDQQWTSIQLQTGSPVNRNALVAQLGLQLQGYLERHRQGGFVALKDEWEQNHAWQGRPVSLIAGISQVDGVVLGVDHQGALRLSVDGVEKIYNGGELSLRLRDDS